jgi:hypothetical protein
MNCPACGALVEADAQFCVECGSPLEDSETEATIVGQTLPVDAESAEPPVDKPVTVPEAANDVDDLPDVAETPVVDPSPLPVAPPESDTQPEEPPRSSGENEPELSEPSDTAKAAAEAPGEGTPSGENGGSSRRTRLIVGGVVLLLIMILCCCSVLVGAMFGIMSSELGQEILRELGTIPKVWPVV